MKIPLSWIREFVNIPVPVSELTEKLTMAGLEVSDTHVVGKWENCFVGCVRQVENHPNADRLFLCTVDIGTSSKTVVCGAPNVSVGQKIAFAMVGAKLIDGRTGKEFVLASAKIRGLVSEGMICSERELGMGEEHDGILVLPYDAPLGIALSEYLGDEVLDLDVTPNRPDWLSILGVAYEVAALIGGSVTPPPDDYTENDSDINDDMQVTIAAPDLCGRYCASLIRGIRVGPSPLWLRDRIEKVGMRSINNVVDVTNYVMLEYGQPLHAFDYETLSKRKIIVRRAYTGEVMKTLDEVERVLDSSNLVIADDRDAIALAGVIGGADSGITTQTAMVLLESASFDATNNRRTAQAFDLRTEATIRFEKGSRPGLAMVALRRATQLLQQVAGGTVNKGIIDVYPERQDPEVLCLTNRRMKQILGVRYPLKQVEHILSSLGFRCVDKDNTRICVTVPSWRTDIAIEDDLVEEVARIKGYDGIPSEMLASPIPQFHSQKSREFREEVRDFLVKKGMQETISYSAIGMGSMERIRCEVDPRSLLKLANPMSTDHEYMRPNLRASLMSTLFSNLSYYKGPIAVFEIGRVYLSRGQDLPDEREVAAGILCGPRSEEGWLTESGRFGFYDGKGMIEALLGHLGHVGQYLPVDDLFLHPGRAASILLEDMQIGMLGEVHPTVQDAYGVDDGPIVFFEVDIKKLFDNLMPVSRLKPLFRYPSSIRDIAIVVGREVLSARVEAAIRAHQLIDRVVLFDVYEGENVGSGKVSLAYRLYFQSRDRTLSAMEVEKALGKIVKTLETDCGALLRTGTGSFRR